MCPRTCASLILTQNQRLRLRAGDAAGTGAQSAAAVGQGRAGLLAGDSHWSPTLHLSHPVFLADAHPCAQVTQLAQGLDRRQLWGKNVQDLLQETAAEFPNCTCQMPCSWLMPTPHAGDAAGTGAHVAAAVGQGRAGLAAGGHSVPPYLCVSQPDMKLKLAPACR